MGGLKVTGTMKGIFERLPPNIQLNLTPLPFILRMMRCKNICPTTESTKKATNSLMKIFKNISTSNIQENMTFTKKFFL